MNGKTVLITYYSRILRDRCNLQELFCERWDSRPEWCMSRGTRSYCKQFFQ